MPRPNNYISEVNSDHLHLDTGTGNIDIKQHSQADNVCIIIMCAGLGNRWKLSYPKQIALIQGVPNIVRTVDILLALGLNIANIKITVNEANFTFFPTNLPLFITPASDREIDRFRNVFSIINDYEKIIYLYGDVVYDKDDLNFILRHQKDAFLGSIYGNTITNKKCGEICAVVIYDIARFISNVNEVANKYESKLITREIGWEVYSNRLGTYPFLELSDKTNDYDTVEEYLALKDFYDK